MSHFDEVGASGPQFVVARNPDNGSALPYLLRVPVMGGPALVFACRETWPGAKDVFCHALRQWPLDAEVLEEVPVRSCHRQGGTVQLVLERRMRRRSVFVWTTSRGRSVVFWRTRSTIQASRPGLRVPAARGLDRPLEIAVDVRERYAWRFAKDAAQCTRRELPAGDYGVFADGRLIAAVERKSVTDLVGSAVSGALGMQLDELARLPRAILVIEGRLSQALKVGHVRPDWMMNVVAALQAGQPHVGWLFAESPTLAQAFAYRWLAAASAADPMDRAAATGMAERSAPYMTQLALPVYDRSGRIAEAASLAESGTTWTTASYSAHFSISRATAREDLKQLVGAGVLDAVGSGRARHYERSVGWQAGSAP